MRATDWKSSVAFGLLLFWVGWRAFPNFPGLASALLLLAWLAREFCAYKAVERYLARKGYLL